MLRQAVDQQVASRPQLLPEAAQVRPPPRLGDDIEGGGLEDAAWALVVASPLMVLLTVLSALDQAPHASPTQWWAFAYLCVVSMFLGFFAWYRGLALGPMSTVSQVQLVQPVLSIGWATLILGEQLTWATVLGGLAVVGCAALAVRARLTANAAATTVSQPRPLPTELVHD